MLLNLETRWINEKRPSLPNSREVTSRVGELNSQWSFLSGGLANHNYDLGDNRILRIYKRPLQGLTIDLESRLNDAHWVNFVTAKTLAAGADFLIQRKLQFSELEDSGSHGFITGLAIGEIHNAQTSKSEGYNNFLSALFNTTHLSDLILEKIDWAISSKKSLRDHYKDWLYTSLSEVIKKSAQKIDLAAYDKVLLHGDCKPSNIKKNAFNNNAVIFDWEFSFVGPRLVDIGHFLRWGVSAEFLSAFISEYKKATQIDLSESLHAAKLIDLVNVSFQLEKAIEGSHKEFDLLNYLESIITGEKLEKNHYSGLGVFR